MQDNYVYIYTLVYTCILNYVYMQDNYVCIHDNYVYMEDNYTYM